MTAPPPPRPFNQTERIIARLRDLVRSYPKGLGLVKEFLQNADDAGASVLHVIYDRQRHPGEMDNPEQEVVLGPALLFVNDRTFTEQDIENIQHIGGGGKLHEARGTGRFGQGFNACYSVSDHPTLLTGDWVIWFDPHRRAHSSGQNATGWFLKDVTQSWPAWVGTFTPAGHVLNSPRYNGTVFRFPLRSQEDAHRSEILNEAFTEADFEVILAEVRDAGPALLVFLRSVQTLRIDEITPNGERRERFRLETTNEDEVKAARAPLRAVVQGDPAALLTRWMQSAVSLPRATYRHIFRLVKDGQPREQSWMVVTGLFRGPNNSLLEHAKAVCTHNEKALPWAGAAAPLDADGLTGGLACFLPLPEPAMWPVWLHGWFDLDSARRGITRQAGMGETTRIRATWNKELLRHGVGPACAALIEQLRGDAAITADPYLLWLQPSDAKDEYDRALVEGFYAELGTRPVFRCVGQEGAEWHSLEGRNQDFWALETSWHTLLRDPLIAHGYTLVDPALPVFAVQALQKTGYPAPILSANVIRDAIRPLDKDRDIDCALQEAPWPSLRRPEWVTVLARFCAQDGPDKLSGLPLARLADGRLHTFGKCGAIYLVTDAERELLAAIPHRMLDVQFQEELKLTAPVPALNLKRLDVPELVACVQEILRADAPIEAWLVLLFEYLEQLPPVQVRAHKEALCKLAIVPDQEGRLRRPGYVHTPTQPRSITDALREALVRLGMHLLGGSDALLASIQRFSVRHPGFIWPLTADHLAWALHSHAEEPWMRLEALAHRTTLAPILDFLSPPTWLGKEDRRLAGLRRLPMLPTTHGALVAADTKALYVPGGFPAPHGIGVSHILLDTGEGGLWASLFRALNIHELKGVTFAISMLHEFPNATAEVQLKMLRWLRDSLHDLEAELSPDQRKKFRFNLRMAAILPITGGGMGAPRHTYHPDAEGAIKVLGDVAKVPDLELLGDDLTQWHNFFSELGLLRTPHADDLLEAVEQCVAAAESHGPISTRARIETLRDHIAEHWDSLANPKNDETQKFADALAAMAWLPAARLTREKVAAAATWPDRLFKASELAAPRFLHLVASVSPILEGSAFSDAMAAALRLRTQVSIEEILRHFAAVRALSVNGATKEVQGARKTAFESFLRYISGLPEGSMSDWQPHLTALRDVPCVLLRDVWWRPRCVFLESLTFESDWCVSSLEDPDWSGRPRIAEGLARLGARAKPTPMDWVEMLGEQHTRAAGRPLTDAELRQVHAVLQQLQVESRQWLQSQPIYIPAADSQLLLAREILLPEHPRLNRLPPLRPLPLVEETELSLEMARRAGARSLRDVLQEELADEPLVSQEADLLLWAEATASKLRSLAFYEVLRRLAWHEAVERGDEDPHACADTERLLLPQRLTLRIAHALCIASAFRDTGEIVFKYLASSFWDEASATLWISQGSKRKMGDELIRTLASACGLSDTLRLSRLLDAEPEGMATRLDEEGIPPIPTRGQASLPPTWVEPVHLPDAQTLADMDPDEREVLSVHNDESQGVENFIVDDASDMAELSEGPSGPSTGNGASWQQSRSVPMYGSNGKAGLRLRQTAWAGEALPRGRPSLTAHPPEAPTKPGFGSRQPWSPDAPWAGQTGVRRLRSYVHREGLSDYDTGSAEFGRADPIDEAARQRVLDWERARGRTSVEAPDDHQGYDLESSGLGPARYIKVKGIDGPWTARGVGLTVLELRKALELGPAWWLYVVEHTMDPDRAVVHDLRNPFLEATEYRFDGGWRIEALAEEAQAASPTEGETVTLDDGRQAKIVEVEAWGQLWKVTLFFADGHEEVRRWRPSWRQS